ncbi:MAG TPA: ATP-dependent DNA helicase UvrD2 [Gaiellaceae bacterium]|nr:ATP-dependent DNA helicase UvrD2 [Gaiellaceae bacterium]
MDAERIFAGLNPEQQAAARATRGPVCILAGAGTGKTTTITRRIAWQVASGAFPAAEIVAVTFTDKAAGELRGRLAALGVEGMRASTFHSAALALLRRFGGAPGRILATKALTLRRIGNGLPRPYRFRPAGDLATEIEWAKNRRLTPSTYLAGLGEHEPPLPADLAVRVFREYERRKAEAGELDFEDLLEHAIRLLEEDDEALTTVRDRWRAFTVDEYQDVNLLQQTLLDLWLGDRDDVCVVGDDYQSIYGFTGASAEWLLALPQRFPQTHVVRLEQNYRSTPQVLELANRLVPKLGGSTKTLRATLAAGPEPDVRPNADVVERVVELVGAGVPLEEQAVLVRTNARTTEFEEAFHDAGIPFQGASLLDRDAARQLVKVLRDGESTDVAAIVRRTAEAQGLLPNPPDKLGDREQTRQADLARLVRLAEQFEGTLAEFVASLHERFGASAGRGIHLLTLHRAKGLEWEAVYLPRLEEGELPIRRAEVDEERRLLYVGVTRAKRHLLVTWQGKPSRFLTESDLVATGDQVAAVRTAKLELTPAVLALKEWRLARARAEEVPAYVVFNDRTLAELVARSPRTIAELAAVPGIGPAKLERFGPELLATLARVA